MEVIKKAFFRSLTVMTRYVVLGIGFGILLHNAGFCVLRAFAVSVFIYAGSMQYVGIMQSWKRNAVLSILLGTVLYMVLIRMI